MNLRLLICAFLISGIPVSVIGSEEARPFAAKADIDALGTMLDMFQVDCGRYPSTAEGLNALVSCPTNIPARKWKGPYLKDFGPATTFTLKDPWGHPYVYICPGIHNTNGFDLYSCGGDGLSKSQGNDLDDINNWNKLSPRGGYDFSKGRLVLRMSILLMFVVLFALITWLAKADIPGAVGASARRKREGVFSLVWVSPGFLAFEVFNIEWWRITESTLLGLFIVFGVWWGFGMLLAISGFKSGSRVGFLASLATTLCFGYFLWDALAPHVSG